jgi:hypothetical protein
MARKPLLNEMAMAVDVDGWWWCGVEGPHLLTFIYVSKYLRECGTNKGTNQVQDFLSRDPWFFLPYKGDVRLDVL